MSLFNTDIFGNSFSREIAQVGEAGTGRGIAARLRSLLKKAGLTNIEIKGSGPRGGIPYASGFADGPKGLFYFSVDDHQGSVLMRTAQHRKDWTGGGNTYPHDLDQLRRLAGLQD